MKKILYAVLLISLFSCSEEVVNHDFVKSNWGDKYSIVKETYQNEKNFNAIENLVSYRILSMKDTAVVSFMFSNDVLISSTVKYNLKKGKGTKKLYDAYIKKNRDKFGFETFSSNQQVYDYKKYEQKIWEDSKTLLSLRLDSNRVRIDYFDKSKMPIK